MKRLLLLFVLMSATVFSAAERTDKSEDLFSKVWRLGHRDIMSADKEALKKLCPLCVKGQRLFFRL